MLHSSSWCAKLCGWGRTCPSLTLVIIEGLLLMHSEHWLSRLQQPEKDLVKNHRYWQKLSHQCARDSERDSSSVYYVFWYRFVTGRKCAGEENELFFPKHFWVSTAVSTLALWFIHWSFVSLDGGSQERQLLWGSTRPELNSIEKPRPSLEAEEILSARGHE